MQFVILVTSIVLYLLTYISNIWHFSPLFRATRHSGDLMTKSTRMTGYMEPNNKYYVVQPIIIFLSDVHAHWLCKWNIRALLQYFPIFSFLLVETHFMFKILVIHKAAVKMKEKLLHLFYICCFTQHSQLMLIFYI